MRLNCKVMFQGKQYEFIEATPEGLLLSDGMSVFLVQRHEVKVVK